MLGVADAAQNTPQGGAVGIDSHLVSHSSAATYESTFKGAGTVAANLLFLNLLGRHFKPLSKNLVDEVWPNRPALPTAHIFPHDIKYDALYLFLLSSSHALT